MASAIGPVFGYIGMSQAFSHFVHFESLGGALQLTRWVDFDAMNEEDVTIERGDPAWIGAWWVGIISCFGFAFITSIPFFGFPKSIPGTAKEVFCNQLLIDIR